MAFVIKNTENKEAQSDLPEASERSISKSQPPEPGNALDYVRKPETGAPNFFTIYKKGQGYWTRMGTVAGILLIAGFTTFTLYEQIPPLFSTLETGRAVAAGICVGFLLGYAFIAWKLLNKPSHVDFLIATDSEMKKVNWTSRRELIGSTKIVIIFMFFVAIFLFAVDTIFGYLMYWIHVMDVSPFGGTHNLPK